MNDRVDGAEKSYCIQNFEIAAGRRQGERRDVVFLDSDLYKWLESAAYALAAEAEPALGEKAEYVVELI